MTEHVNGEALAAYIDGRLDRKQRGEVEDHLGHCRECRRELADVAELLAGKEEVPGEFLEKALGASADRAAWRRPLLLRPAFGIAAAFLVAVAAGFFFLGRGRVALPPAAEGGAAAQSGAAHGDLQAGGEKLAATQPDGKAAPPSRSGPRKEKKIAGRALELQERNEAETVADAAFHAPAETDKDEDAGKGAAASEEKARLRESVRRETPPAGGESGLGMAAKAAPAPLPPLPDRLDASRRAVAEQGAEPGRRPMRAAAGALQLFLAASGRAAAPPGLGMVEAFSGPLARIEGEAAADLLPPGLAGVDDWLPAGAALELTIDARGRVLAVTLLGEWEEEAAFRARREALELAFAPRSAARRRAVLLREPAF